MSLIEQLGGYDFVKNKSESNILYGEKIYLKRALLEYRRQHNIFEVDDLVVLTEPLYSSAIWSVHQANNDMVFISKDFGFVPMYKSEVRHATTQEIESGHRL